MGTKVFDEGFHLDTYSSEDIFSMLLRYGLFIGAIFQLICIGASILLPAANDGANSEDGNEDFKFGGDVGNNIRRLHKMRKQEKKKRR